MLSCRSPVALAVIAVVFISQSAIAQSNAAGTFRLSASAGLMLYDLSVVSTAALFAARLDIRLASAIIIEPGVTHARVLQQFGSSSRLLIPEVQLHLQLPTPYVAPFVGIGVGRAFDMRDAAYGGTVRQQSLAAVVGIRARLGEYFGARAELRARTLRRGTGGTVELSAGLSYRL